jgi:histidinol phosphatase-like enzyme (inositol monophosphatase family)
MMMTPYEIQCATEIYAVMNEVSTREIESFAHELVAAAAAVVLPYFRRPLAIENKGKQHFDPVTEADRATERCLREMISARFPRHEIVGEEYGITTGSGPYRWILDPIDGTRAFMSGVPTWGTLIALYRDDQPIFGVMNQPFVDERFYAGIEDVWWARGAARRQLATSEQIELHGATLFATSPDMFSAVDEWPRFQALSRAVRLTRYGIDCYAYCLLAAGHIDLVVEAGLGIYDVAALVPIVERAGGVITNWQGGKVSGGQVIAAANPTLHAHALRMLQNS